MRARSQTVPPPCMRLSDFERVAYTLSGDPDSIDPGPASAGEVLGSARPALRPRAPYRHRRKHGVHDRRQLPADLDQRPRRRDLYGSLRLGRTSGLDASFYQPLDTAHRWFVEPGLTAQRSIEDLFDDGDAVTRYDFSSGWGYLDAGHVFGNRAELRAGIRAGVQAADREIGSQDLPEISSEGYGGLALRYTFDSRDRDVLWQRGTVARVTISAAKSRWAPWRRTTDSRGRRPSWYRSVATSATCA